MSKVDMSRYIECPVCHTWQITLNPCQKCVARRMAEHGTLPENGVVPLDPFKIYSQEQKDLRKREYKRTYKPKRPRQSAEERRDHMLELSKMGNQVKIRRSLKFAVPVIVGVLKDGDKHWLADLIRASIIPLGVVLTNYVPTRTMHAMGLLEWKKEGTAHNSPIRIWIPALKIQDAIEYAEELKNGKD